MSTSKSILKRLCDHLYQLALERGLPISSDVRDERRRTIEITLHSGKEITLVVQFSLLVADRIYVSYGIGFRWPKAENLSKAIRAVPTEELPLEVLKARNSTYAIAALSITQSSDWFAHQSPISYNLSQATAVNVLCEEVLEIAAKQVVPAFSHYCEPDGLADAAMSSASQSKLDLLPVTVLVILAAAKRQADYLRMRDLFIQRQAIGTAQLTAVGKLDAELEKTMLH